MAKLRGTSKKTKGSTRARATRIDKDVKTTMRQSRVLSLLYDLMWSYRYFKYLALALLVADAVLGYLIIQYIPYTEIDWRAYMQQVEAFKAGERDYINIRGDTGPLVYPAGFLYVFSVLHTVTDAGTNIRRAQYIFLGFYLITIATMLAIYNRARVMPPWAVVFICISKRLHSIYMLRLFNDGIAMMLLWIAVYLLASQKWRMGCAVFSFAVSIKMNVLLFAPALFFLLLQSCGILRTAWYLFICASIQVILGLPFLRHNWFNYLHKAFELSRVFTFQWTVNWKFLPEDVFVSKELALGLLGAHILFLILFLQKHFNIIGTFRAVFYKPFAIYEPFPIRSEVVVTSMFVINFVGIAFARTLHYQFYSWFYPTLPYLLWKTNMPLLFKVKSLIIAEYAFNAYPATPASSTVLQLMNLFLIISLYFTEDESNYVPYLDADARINLLSFINEECFDGARQFALYYGSVTEDLAEGAAVTSIDEREVVLSLPKLKLTLAVGFGSSAPVTSEGYGRQVLKVMLAEAAEGIAAGETMGSLINKEYAEAQERETKSTHGMASLRRRGPGGIEDSPGVPMTSHGHQERNLNTNEQQSINPIMTVALAFESDDGSRAIQTTVQVIETDGVRAENVDVRSYYEIERTVAQILSGGYRNIALQFPDSLLPDAPRVQQELKNGLEDAYERIFILGDTSYGSCCVDEVAAQHLFADCIVHYGRTCLSATSKIPVVYVFGNAPIDVDHCVDVIASHIVDAIAPEKAVVLLYEPSYNYAMAAIVTHLQERIGGERKLLLGDMTTFYDPNKVAAAAEEVLSSSTSSVYIGGQEVKLDRTADDDEELQTTITPEKFAIVYIGTESPHLTSILLRHSALDCYSYHPVEQQIRKEGASVNRALMRRYFLVQQAKEAQIYGILMGTLGVSKYLDVVHSLQKLIKKSGRKSYLFVVGKVNVPKLANYAEIDAFVLVACQQSTLMDSKEFYKPIVTPYELQLALSSTEEWTGEYKTDFREVLPAITKTTQELDDETNGEGGDDSEEDSDKPYFSLVTGTYKNSVRANSSSLAASSEADNSVSSTALQVKNERADLVEYRSEAGEYLASREYRGLEPRIGETPAHVAVMGATGIARGYTHES